MSEKIKKLKLRKRKLIQELAEINAVIQKDSPPGRYNVKYPFHTLKKRGSHIFIAGADSVRVRQAARSFEQHHPEVAAAGDRLRIRKTVDKKGAPGAEVRRVLSDE